MGALDRAGEAFEFVQVRHEEMAAFMACAHAEFTGEVGVCLATSGPGAIHLLNGLYDRRDARANSMRRPKCRSGRVGRQTVYRSFVPEGGS